MRKKVKIIHSSTNDIISYATELSSGMDLRYSGEKIVINPMERQLLPTGVFLELPKNYEGQIRSRSGLAINYGIIVLNSPGTIDADYRGEIKVAIINLGTTPYTITFNEKIAQIIFAKIKRVKIKTVTKLKNTIRNNNGFGSTGKK